MPLFTISLAPRAALLFSLPLLAASCASDANRPVRYDMHSCFASLRAGMPDQPALDFGVSSDFTHRGGDWTFVSEAKSPTGWRKTWTCDFHDGAFQAAQWIESQ
ncbi:hypothetical protein [Oceanibaculum pacificum]|uniref:Uncharacterized protein n=1 Tax=Oceanibaculum pacificum TaxID=580166 RepID=A0A154WFA1_9PROT|nr:hypothetical protein [Oceanibaculum pacificum]KZD12166.1 hypothetical protein AUP43_17225 [Oceanibaculum pacificum]